MHELSIANQLVLTVEDAAREVAAVRVNTVRLRLGVLAGVVREALEFAFEIVTEGTLLAASRLVIEEVAVRVHCDACDLDTAPVSPQRLRCPLCDRPTARLIAGQELEIRSIDYDTAEDVFHGGPARGAHPSCAAAPDPRDPAAAIDPSTPVLATSSDAGDTFPDSLHTTES